MRWLFAGLALVVSGAGGRPQEGGGPEPEGRDDEPAIRLQLYRWKEDYSRLADKKEPLTAWERLKYIPLGSAPAVGPRSDLPYLSLGGDARWRIDSYSPYFFGLGRSGRDFASRQAHAFFHGDLHLSPYLRVFAQLDVADENGPPAPRAFDQSAVDARQVFADLSAPVGAGKLTLRLGRQELSLGGTRWMAVRDPTNIRRSFDGALLEYAATSMTLRSFAARPVVIKPHAFDDTTATNEAFYGGYATFRNLAPGGVKLDLYLLGKQLDEIAYTRGRGREERYSAGARVYGSYGAISYAFEGTHQFGTFASRRISADGAAADVGYTLGEVWGRPKFGLKAQYASGDNPRSGVMGTFSGPYPAASVISESSIIAISNARNLQPYLQLSTPWGMWIEASWNWAWRDSLDERAYGPANVFLGPAKSRAREIAQIGQIQATWDVNPFIQIRALYSHSPAGAYLKAGGGRTMDYARAQIMARF